MASSAAYVLFVGVSTVSRVLPYRVGYRVFAWAADVAWVFARRTRALVEANIDQVAKSGRSRQLRRSSRLAFRNLFWGYFEMFRLRPDQVRDVRERVTIDGAGHVKRAHSDSPGRVFMFIHVGALEASSQVSLLFPEERFALIVGEMADPRFERLFDDLRSRSGLETVSVKRMREAIRLLRKGCHVIIAGDFASTGSGRNVEFFGRTARFPSGALRVAEREKTEVCLVSNLRTDLSQPWMTTLTVSPPIPIDTNHEVAETMERLVPMIERIIEQAPHQWLAFRRIWLEDDR